MLNFPALHLTFGTADKKPDAKSKIHKDYDIIVSYFLLEVKLNPSDSRLLIRVKSNFHSDDKYAILFSMSMFREHWIGGLVAYSTFFIISLIVTFTVPILYDTLPQEWNPTIPPVRDVVKIIGCFAVAVLFGLWPDVDIKSKSQKIFYTVLFGLNVGLIVFLQKYLESALLGLFAMLPIMSKHRGWTHAKITMILLPSVFLLIPIYAAYSEWETAGSFVDSLNAVREWDGLTDAVRNGFPFYVASFVGYATHLHLDGILFRSRKAQRRKARVN